LKNQEAIERNETSANGKLSEMLDSTTQQKEYDTAERAEKESTHEEQARLDHFTQWVDTVAAQPHIESSGFGFEPEPAQASSTEPLTEIAETTQIPSVDLEILAGELYLNPVETKKELEPVERAETN